MLPARPVSAGNGSRARSAALVVELLHRRESGALWRCGESGEV